MHEKGVVFYAFGDMQAHKTLGLFITVPFCTENSDKRGEQWCWLVQFLLSLMIFEIISAWASSFTDRPWCIFFSAALCAARCRMCIV